MHHCTVYIHVHPVSSKYLCRILKDVLFNQVVSASSMQSKQLRNDILMICLCVAQICPDAPFVVRIKYFVAM